MNTAPACPITVRPGQILGYWKGDRPIYAIAGGSAPAGGAPTPAPAGDPAPAPAPAPASAPKPADPAPTPGVPAEWDGKIESLPPAVQKLITDARGEAGKARTTAKETAAAEAREELLKALGLTKEGDKVVDPAELAKQLADKDTKLATLQRERSAEKAARTHHGDVDALLDSRKFATDLEALDPTAADFDTKVDALVKKAIDDNPKLKAVQAAGVSGGQFTGGSGENGKQRPTSLFAAIKNATNP